MTKSEYDGMIKEIKAGMFIYITCPQDRAYNQASERAISIIEKYKKRKRIISKK